MKHLFKRGIAIILMLAMILSVAPLSVFAAEDTTNEFVVLSTTDMHGRVWDKNVLNDTNMNNSMLNVATAVKEIRATYDRRVLLLDNGDTFQGTPVSSYQLSLQKQGLTELPNPMALCLKEIGYDAVTIGNHEFNYAWDLMQDVRDYMNDGTQGHAVPSLCANLYYEETGENVFSPIMIKAITLGDKTYKIAVLGFVNTDCPRWDVPDNYPGIVFTHPDNTTGSMAWEVERYVEQVRDRVDLVIVAYHSGLGDGAAPEDIQFGVNSENQILSVIKNTTGVDMIIAGHDHSSSYSGKTYKDKEGKDVLVVNGAGNNLTKTVFAVNEEGKLYIKSNSVIGLSTKAADADLKAKMAPYVELASEYVNQECGTILAGDWSKSTKFYLEQTDTMDIIGRAQMAMGTKYLAEKYNTEEAVAELYAATGLDHLTVDMSSTSVVVSGSYTVQPGTMTMKKIYQLYKYDNTLYLIPLTGQQIKDVLEFNASERLSVNTASGTPVYSTIGDDFTNPIFYGLDFVYDMSEEVGNRAEIKGFANGKEFKLDETYIFAVNNYHLGNGPFAAYSTEDAIWSQTDDLGGGVVQDLIAEWLTAETAANGGVNPAPSNWKLTYDAEIVAGKAEGEYIGTYVDPTTLQSEDQIMIYYPAGNTLISNVASGSRLAASADVTTGVSDAGNKQAGTNTATNIFTVVKNDDGSVAFVDAEGKYMTSNATGNGLKMAEGASALANWTFEETDGGYFAHNEGANYNGNYNQYLEFYNGFTTYGMGSPAAYTFQFYKLGVEEDNGGNDDDDNGGSGTDIIDLTDGEYVIAAYVDGKYYAMANKFASKISGVEIPVTAEGKVLTEDALGYTLHIIENSNGWNIEGEEGYLSYVSGTNLGTSEEPYYWNIAPSEVAEGLWNITSVATPERGILYQLGTGNRFGGYAMSNVGKPDYLEVKLLPVDDGNPIDPEPEIKDIVILYTNDIHTYIGNDGLRYSNVAALKAELEAQGKAVLLVDAGDHIQGTAYGAMDKGATIIELMNAAGYDLATLGNHEFDYGMARALEVTNDAAFPYVSANFYHEEAGVRGENVLDSYKIFEVGGLKIAFVGITTPETFTKTTPAYFMDEDGNYIYGISAGDDGSALYADVQAAVDAAWESGADYVIALGHLGDDPASKPWTSEELIANVEGLDAFIDGHSHSTVEGKDVMGKDGYYVRLTQTGQYLDAIGMLTISDYEITTELITEYAGVDEEVKAIEDAWIAEVDTLLGEVIAKSEVDFKISDDTGRLIRKQETNLGDFCADALYYLFDVTEGLGVDVAIMNGGGIRANMDAGDISYKTTKTVHTFGNVACLIEVTGQQILDALEWGAKNVGVGENGGFLHVSGVTYEIHSYIPSTVQADDKGVWCGAPTGEYRVKNVQIGGEPLDVTKTYKLAGYNYTLRDLGDGFAMFDGAVNVKDYVMEDYMVLANYAKSFPDATIKADNSVLGANYGDIYGEGRIAIVTEKEDPENKDIVILYTNDIHTYINNEGLKYSNVAALKAELEAEGKTVILVDAGDHVQGTAYGSMDKGETIIKLMNAAGYDLATLGNHEFDYGMARALELVGKANFPYVSANFYNEKNGVKGETVLDAYKIFEVDGMKIALVGITTPETFTKSTPAYFMDENGNYIYGISAGDDGAALYADVQAAIDAAYAEGATYVIALGHLGDDPASDPWNSEDVISNVTGLDAFIDGHSHSTVEMKEVTDKDGNVVILTQTGQYLDAVGKMTITENSITTELITEYANADENVKAIEDAWAAEVDTLLGEIIAKNEVDFRISDDTGRLIRKQETNLGDFAADALYYLFDVTEGLEPDLAIMNGGGIRANMPVGDVSYKTTKTVHTFGNVACLIEVTGQQILDALEWGAKNVGVGENGGFLHVSGVTYEIHSYIPSTVQADDKGVWCGAPTGEYRVKNVKIGGEDLDLTKTYKMAGYNYTLRDLGDGFAMFDGAVNVKDYVMEDYMVLANYAKSFPEATIKADNSVLGATYGDINGEGRIVIVEEEPTDPFVNPYTDVAEDAWYYDYIMEATQKGLINGLGNGLFKPEANITRAQFATILYRALGAPSAEGLENTYTDLDQDWYMDAILYLSSKGIVNGVGNNRFAPDSNITREQMVTMLFRAAGITVTEGYEVLDQYEDKDSISTYAVEAMVWAINTGIVNGISETKLAPQNLATRAQGTKVILLFTEQSK